MSCNARSIRIFLPHSVTTRILISIVSTDEEASIKLSGWPVLAGPIVYSSISENTWTTRNEILSFALHVSTLRADRFLDHAATMMLFIQAGLSKPLGPGDPWTGFLTAAYQCVFR